LLLRATGAAGLSVARRLERRPLPCFPSRRLPSRRAILSAMSTPRRRRIPRVRRLAVVLGLATATIGCSSTLREVQARNPALQFPGVPASQQLEVARCIRDAFEAQVGDQDAIVQELALDRDGMHVIGRDGFAPGGAMFDVVVREDAVVARVAPAPETPLGLLQHAIQTCVGAAGTPSR
jgi:hypothetical protein